MDELTNGAHQQRGADADRRARRRLTAEVWIVLGLSLGQSGVYALVSLIAKLTRDTPLSQQTSALNVSRSDRSLLDLTYQLLSIGFAWCRWCWRCTCCHRTGGRR